MLLYGCLKWSILDGQLDFEEIFPSLEQSYVNLQWSNFKYLAHHVKLWTELTQAPRWRNVKPDFEGGPSRTSWWQRAMAVILVQHNPAYYVSRHGKQFTIHDACAVTPIARRFDESKCFICLTSALNNRLLLRITQSSWGVLLTLIALPLMVKEGSYLLSLDHMENWQTWLLSAFKFSLHFCLQL